VAAGQRSVVDPDRHGLLIAFAWPPRDDKSLALEFVNWVVDT
jgi:hypothetical protein